MSFAGNGAAKWITLAMVVSALGTLNSSLLSGARVPYAMARDGLFFRVTGSCIRNSARLSGALVFQGVLASMMALTGTFENLTSLFVFAAWIFYALSVVAMFRLRRIRPDLPRPYRTWGYPMVPALFVGRRVRAHHKHSRSSARVRSSIGLRIDPKWSSVLPGHGPNHVDSTLQSDLAAPDVRCRLHIRNRMKVSRRMGGR